MMQFLRWAGDRAQHTLSAFALFDARQLLAIALALGALLLYAHMSG